MARTRQSIQVIVAKVLDAPPIRQTVPIADAIIGIGGLVDRRARGAELVENLLDLRSRIIPEALCGFVVG